LSDAGAVGSSLQAFEAMLSLSSNAPLESCYNGRMTAAAEFIAQLQSERRGGNVSGETEQHLKHEFRKLGRDASDLMLSAAIGSEIDRLEREAATLRSLLRAVFGVA
jgi:hypothetical protein